MVSKYVEHRKASWFMSIVGPLIAAVLAIGGSYITMEKQMVRIDASVNNLTTTINKVAEEQSAFFKASYVPLMVKVEQQQTAIQDLKNTTNMFKEEMRLYHPVRPYSDKPRYNNN